MRSEVSPKLREIVARNAEAQTGCPIAYTYTQGLRQVQAAANLGDSAATIIGMLPTPF